MLKVNFRTGKRRFKDSEKGLALVESIPVLFMLVVIFNFSLGFFGAIHSGILNSVGSYNYAIETFRFRSNLMYFRPGGETSNYKLSNNRVHGTTQDGSEQIGKEEKVKWPATLRPITFNFVKDDAKKGLTDATNEFPESSRNYGSRTSNTNIWYAGSEYEPQTGTSIQTPRIWIKTVYGICINADCE